MRKLPVITKRFEELEAIAEEVRNTVQSSVPWRYEYVDRSLFEQWAVSTLSLLMHIFGTPSIYYQQFDQRFKGSVGWKEEFDLCYSIFKAARADYERGYLYSVRDLVSADLLDDTLEQATELLQVGYKDVACILSGVALERALRQLCSRHNIETRGLDRMNVELYKAGVYNAGLQKQITAWADRRNNAAHGSWDAYTAADVDDMTRGVKRFISEYFR